MWKEAERKYARLLEGVRIPVSGRGGQSDVLTPKFSVEVKERRNLSKWLVEIRRLLGDSAALFFWTDPEPGIPVPWIVCTTAVLISGTLTVSSILKRKTVPDWIVKAVKQSILASEYEGRIPLVVIHELNNRYLKDICILPEVSKCSGVSYDESLQVPSGSTSRRRASRSR